MNILVVGCGTVGAELALVLEKKGHDVSVLDDSERKLEILRGRFGGLIHCGVPIDENCLKKAGINSCQVVCAVTGDDNTNIMVSLLAKNIYRVPQVITRVFDNLKHDLYESSEYGLKTICSTTLTLDSVLASLEEPEFDEQYLNILSHTCRFHTMRCVKSWEGRRVSEIHCKSREVLFGVIDGNNVMSFGRNNPELKAGDMLVFAKMVD